jgi:hypothetical protein
VTLAIIVPLTYWVGDVLTESKFLNERDAPMTTVGQPSCDPTVDPVIETLKCPEHSEEVC